MIWIGALVCGPCQHDRQATKALKLRRKEPGRANSMGWRICQAAQRRLHKGGMPRADFSSCFKSVSPARHKQCGGRCSPHQRWTRG